MEKEEIKKKIDKEFGNDEEIKKLNEKIKEVENIEETDKERIEIGEIYELIIKILKRYCDIEEKYYSLIAIWVIGTYIQNNFPTYPYLFFNAMKGSGKTRILRLITTLSCDGCLLNSLTEAVLFRTKGTLGIDEFEGVNKKGKENLTELLNSAYKKGITVKRMKKVKTSFGESQIVEEFDVYRPIAMANIRGMDEVLGDRCVTIILDKSNNPTIIKKMEMYESDEDIHQVKTELSKLCVIPNNWCSLCSVDVIVGRYRGWNSYIDTLHNNNYIHTLTTLPTLNTLTTQEEKNHSFFNKLNEVGIDGRNLEIAMPLLIISSILNEEIFDDLLKTFKEVIDEKKKEDIVESLDVSLIDFISQELSNDNFVSIKEFLLKFRESVHVTEDWFNEKWMGRALKRLGLVKEKKRLSYGVMVKLDYEKAQEKIRMFK